MLGTNSLSQSLTALPAPSEREPLAKPETLRLHQKLYRYAKGAPLGELSPQATEGGHTEINFLNKGFPRSGEAVTEGD